MKQIPLPLFYHFIRVHCGLLDPGDATDSLPEAMAWLVLYLAHHPHIQTTIQQEIDALDLPALVSLSNR